MLWAITAYFNPLGYRTRLANYRTFRSRLNVPLVTVEASLGDRFELGPGDADVLVQRGGAALLWQKERLLDIALESLPPECDAVAWLDCDVVFEDGDWAERTQEALGRYGLVHPYSVRQNLGSDGEYGPATVSFGDRFAAGLAEAADAYDPDSPHSSRATTAGLAWAAPRSVLAGGLYDGCILGGGVRPILCAGLGRLEDGVRATQMNERQREHFLPWARQFFAAVGGRVGGIDGRLIHLWHGDLRDRRYGARHAGLAPFAFDPAVDIEVGPTGCWLWSSDKPELHDFIRSYFESRREDGP